jgi:2,3,4,5-tetrahydropyridine-2-carboxylate N-succinyltransferase
MSAPEILPPAALRPGRVAAKEPPHKTALYSRAPMQDAELEAQITPAFADRSLLAKPEVKQAVEEVIRRLDSGTLRVVTPEGPGKYVTNAWVKQAILLYFAIRPMQKLEAPPFEFYDKIPLKRGLEEAGVRVVPPGTVRYGAFVEKGAIIMPGYVNIGAWVGAGTMVDTPPNIGATHSGASALGQNHGAV